MGSGELSTGALRVRANPLQAGRRSSGQRRHDMKGHLRDATGRHQLSDGRHRGPSLASPLELPTRLVVILTDPDEAQRAETAFVRKRFAPRDIKLYTGEEILQTTSCLWGAGPQ